MRAAHNAAMRRPATPADLAAVHAIYMHPEVVPFLTHEPMPLDDFRPVFDELLASGCFFVWEVSGQVAGFYRAVRYPGRARHVALLGTLAVDPRHHGRGVGRAMIEDFAESDNPRALRFYQSLSFVHEGTLRGFYKRAAQAHYVDEWVLGLWMGPPSSGV